MTKKSPKGKAAIAQVVPERAPGDWATAQDRLAAASGLSLLLVEGHQPPALAVSNNNSICEAFQSSPEHVQLCDPYCGEAHGRAQRAGSATEYKCHAGLSCYATPVQIGNRSNLAVIGGRAFVTAADYRTTVDRFRAGDLKELLPKDPFKNVIFADQARLEESAGRVEQAARKFSRESGTLAESPDAIGRAEVRPEVDSGKRSATRATASSSTIELQNEIAQLRGELEYRTQFNESLQHFLERISATDPQKTYEAILKNSKELLLAGRASLFVYDESSNELIMKAAAGLPVDAFEVAHVRLGEGITGHALESGKPLVVTDIYASTFAPAPPERGYQSKSFISYPIIISDRKIGVLNVTEKTGDGVYDEVDLSLIDIIGPQVVLALERAGWQERATEFQLMSITDPLTGLLNRRYLEERLNEELNRSRRYEYPMSFLMIDIDDFKNYNDVNGHQAGDQALQITAHNLKAGLRLEDVACRYGGEEFCILLPQTPVNEAAVISERIRQRIVDAHYPFGSNQPLGFVTVSIGVSTFSRHVDTSERVIAAADRALYRAKSKGKNRIEFYQESLAGTSDSTPTIDERE